MWQSFRLQLFSITTRSLMTQFCMVQLQRQEVTHPVISNNNNQKRHSLLAD